MMTYQSFAAIVFNRYFFLYLFYFKPGDHAAEIIPACQDHLYHMHHEEKAEQDRNDEMFCPGPLISSQHGTKPVELCRFINSKPCEQHHKTHDDNPCVCDPLCCIVFFLWG